MHAVAELTSLLRNESRDAKAKQPIIVSLRGIGPAANEAAPQLLEILRANEPNSQPLDQSSGMEPEGYVGYGDMEGMGQYSSGLDLWKDTVLALGRVRAVQAVPELTDMLRNKSLDAKAKQFIVVSLGEIGPAAKFAIDELKAIAGDKRDPNSHKFTTLQAAAVVAISRIYLPQASKLIPSILRNIIKELDASQNRDPESGGGYGEGGMYGVNQSELSSLEVYFMALIWLGGKEDSELMMHAASPSWNNIRHGSARAYHRLISSPLLPRISESIRNAMMGMNRHLWENPESGGMGNYGYGVSEANQRWTTDGKILALTNAMEIGLEATRPLGSSDGSRYSIRAGTIGTISSPGLHGHLEDDDPQVRMRVAAALIHMGDESDLVKKTLIESAAEAGGDVPPHIKQCMDGNPMSLRQ